MNVIFKHLTSSFTHSSPQRSAGLKEAWPVHLELCLVSLKVQFQLCGCVRVMKSSVSTESLRHEHNTSLLLWHSNSCYHGDLLGPIQEYKVNPWA